MHKIFLLIFCGSYLMISGCTYAPPTIRSNIVNVIRKPDSRIIAVLVNKTNLQEPTGLSAFPDGGRPKILKIELYIYLFDIDSKKLSTLLVFNPSKNQLEGFDSWLKGWDGEDLYFQTSGCAPAWEVYSHGCGKSQITFQYFKVNDQGVSQRVKIIPKILNNGRNSPFVAWQNEINYTRISNNSTSIKIITTDSTGFYKALELDNQGNLRQTEQTNYTH